MYCSNIIFSHLHSLLVCDTQSASTSHWLSHQQGNHIFCASGQSAASCSDLVICCCCHWLAGVEAVASTKRAFEREVAINRT